MLHVILQILAIIGIVLLCILGLLILLILLILFVPIRYRAEGSKSGEDIRLKVRVSYLLRMITVRFEYPKPGSVIARLFGIKVFDTAKKPTEDGDKKNKKKKKQKSDDSQDETIQETETAAAKTEETASAGITVSDTEETKAEKAQTDAVKTDKADIAEETSAETEAEPVNEDSSDTAEEEVKEKLSFRDKIKKIIYTIQKFCDKIKHIKDTIKEIAENISYYKEVITQTENEKLYGRVKDRIFKVLKSIRPRVLRASLHVGTGSPDTTGYLCALYGMLLPVLGNNVILDADFEEAVWEGEFFLKGRITVFTLLRHAVGLLLDKQLRVFVKQLKREE
ncbi:MAG: hypothetical protein HDR14_05940 [Lachnospiraceae bacterium]|nr:hypothetical protein [Lachnospiraceae bacterium]